MDNNEYLWRATAAIEKTEDWGSAAIALAILALAQELRELREDLRREVGVEQQQELQA